ncbi:acyltransferase family protein [bacterium]|nr:acyltransferase family protein [bacterium]
MNASAPNDRLDYLDAVRAFALLLGIVFHASVSFMPFFIGWAVMDISTSSFVSQFMLVSHSFRMELFFLIAGYFSHMTFHRKGAGVFINSRLMRIAIPFVVGWFLLKPLVISGWVMGAESMRGDVNILNGLRVAVQNVIQSPNELFTGSHLWFLYYLLLVTAMALALRAMTIPGSKLYSRATNWADQMIAWLTSSRFSWFALSVPTACCLWFMSNWGMDTPDKSLVPHVPVLCVYGGFFVVGWLLHRQPKLIERFARLTAGRFMLCCGSVVATIVLSRYQAHLGHPNIISIHAGFAVSYAMMMWSLVCLTIGLFKRLFDRPSKAVRYIADSSYWLYLVHLPIVIWLQIAFAELPFHWALKLTAISLLSVGISLVLYDLFVRSTLIGKTLNGRRKERMLFRRRSNDLNKAGLKGINAATESC